MHKTDSAESQFLTVHLTKQKRFREISRDTQLLLHLRGNGTRAKEPSLPLPFKRSLVFKIFISQQ